VFAKQHQAEFDRINANQVSAKQDAAAYSDKMVKLEKEIDKRTKVTEA
jgi:hypothetical protein